jgi:hypothetical protein
VGLLKPGLLRQPQAGELARFNALPQFLAQVFLKGLEFHGADYNNSL